MPKDLVIADDFDRAASYFKKQMKEVVASPYVLFSAPGFYRDDWARKDGNNCYNFALHRPTRDFLQPGALSGIWQREDYVPQTIQEVHEGAVNDGLLYLGSTLLKCPRDHFPVALFLENDEDGDYHWLALRQKVRAGSPTGELVWCHKADDAAPQLIVDTQQVFATAQAKYPVFGGYYAVPHDMPFRDPAKRGPQLF